jgi:CheY-like chemotaxis protein
MAPRNLDGQEATRTPPPTLQAALKLVDEVVHDLNNALLVIRGYGSVLRSSLETPEQLADVDEIAKAVDHATRLTGRLLELARSGRPDGADAGVLVEGSETILVVEDDEAVRGLVCRILESAGYIVLLATRPSEAEQLLAQEQNVDLLLSDVVMPEMSGFELAARLRRDRPDLRTLFISGNAYVASSSTHSTAELLKKPFAPSELTLAVRRTLDAPVVAA